MKSEDPKPEEDLKPEENRLRKSYREQADRLNPHPAATVYDSYGRPRPKSNHHQWIGKWPR